MALPPISQKYCVASISSPDGRRGLGMDMMPIGPPVKSQRLAVTSTMKPNASVTIARYGPLARRLGSASRAPATAESMTPAVALAQNGQPAFVASKAEV